MMMSLAEYADERAKVSNDSRVRKVLRAKRRRSLARFLMIVGLLFIAYQLGVDDGYDEGVQVPVTLQQTELVSSPTGTVDPTTGAPWPVDTQCSRIDWEEINPATGKMFVPFDRNEDGFIDCHSDVELGS